MNWMATSMFIRRSLYVVVRALRLYLLYAPYRRLDNMQRMREVRCPTEEQRLRLEWCDGEGDRGAVGRCLPVALLFGYDGHLVLAQGLGLLDCVCEVADCIGVFVAEAVHDPARAEVLEPVGLRGDELVEDARGRGLC